MKTSQRSIHPRWDEAVEKRRADTVPALDVRVAVRRSLEQELRLGGFTTAAGDWEEILLTWFRGLRGGVLAVSAVVCLLLTLVVVIGQGRDGASQEDSDRVMAFIDSGDWSEWI